MEESYPRIFSMSLLVAPDSIEDRIPRRFCKEFEIASACLDGVDQGFILASPKGRPSMLSSRALVRAVAKEDARRVVIYSPYLDYGLMKALASEGIAYIKDEQNVFLPFLGMAATPVPENGAPAPMSLRSQRIALNLIAGRWDGLTATDLAEACGVSRAAISKCLAEISAICPAVLSSEWKCKVLRNPGASKEELLEIFEPYLVSPVKRRFALKGEGALDALKGSEALLCGESALSFYTDLAFDPGTVHVAIYAKDVARFREGVGESWVEAAWFEKADVVVEEWAYELDGSSDVSVASTGLRSLDALGLFAQMKDSQGKDVRLADAIAQLREAACL